MDRKYKIGGKLIFSPKADLLIDDSGQSEVVTLGSNESRLLLHLLENSNRTVSRKELISVLWNDRDIFVDDSSLTQSVSTLRKAMNDSRREPLFIKTVPKLGYEFIAPVVALHVDSVKSSNTAQMENADRTVQLKSDRYRRHHVLGTTLPQVLITNSMLLRYSIFNSLLLGGAILKPNVLSALLNFFSADLYF
ncbi:winged helix-turn-helix domain-containing protein [Vibrio sp. 404]|uniref:Winged helix-turn-helix domain-containing protein n=1 Tax=Vibrio marinisediminis TaxID=2758441 RepID=A0A7W2IS38_9VIBR|nr:winged helix-turn-helix domain-containing protein [Vibrio marinisediminis]MBA5760929.1 winged helix-turn-helix domain-containing protein [Vibrio marinisediminis]